MFILNLGKIYDCKDTLCLSLNFVFSCGRRYKYKFIFRNQYLRILISFYILVLNKKQEFNFVQKFVYWGM